MGTKPYHYISLYITHIAGWITWYCNIPLWYLSVNPSSTTLSFYLGFYPQGRNPIHCRSCVTGLFGWTHGRRCDRASGHSCEPKLSQFFFCWSRVEMQGYKTKQNVDTVGYAGGGESTSLRSNRWPSSACLVPHLKWLIIIFHIQIATNKSGSLPYFWAIPNHLGGHRVLSSAWNNQHPPSSDDAMFLCKLSILVIATVLMMSIHWREVLACHTLLGCSWDSNPPKKC
jgi:hypothetical protein